MMTKAQAVELYLKKHPVARTIIRAIKNWDARLTMLENSKRCGMTQRQAHHVAYSYKMDYRKRSERPQKILALRKFGFTFDQIGKIMNLSKQRIHQILEKP